MMHLGEHWPFLLMLAAFAIAASPFVLARLFGFIADRLARRGVPVDCPRDCLLSARFEDGKRYCHFCGEWVKP